MKKSLVILLIYLTFILVLNGITNLLTLPSSPLGNPSVTSCSYLGYAIFLINLLVIPVIYFALQMGQTKPLKGCFKMPTIGIAVLSAAGLILVGFGICVGSELINVPNIAQMDATEIIKCPCGIIAIGFVSPVASELAFRRGIMGSLLETERWRKYALVFSSVCFAILHISPLQVVISFVLSLFLGWLYLRTRSLVLPLLCHIIFNSASLAQLNIYGIGTRYPDILGSYTNSVIVFVVTVILLVPTLILLNKKLPHYVAPKENANQINNKP